MKLLSLFVLASIVLLFAIPARAQVDFLRRTHFKKLPDASGWAPEPCTAR